MSLSTSDESSDLRAFKCFFRTVITKDFAKLEFLLRSKMESFTSDFWTCLFTQLHSWRAVSFWLPWLNSNWEQSQVLSEPPVPLKLLRLVVLGPSKQGETSGKVWDGVFRKWGLGRQVCVSICVSISVDLGVEKGSVCPDTDVESLAMTELLSRLCELLNFPAFSPPFNSCGVCASCSTSVPRMHLSDCSLSLGMCCAGAGLPKGSTNAWGFHLKLGDSLEYSAQLAEIRAMV